MTLPSFLLALLLQATPTGGAITKYVPPVPTPASFISDQRAVLTPAQRSELDTRIKAIQQAGLGDIAVAILPSIGDYSPNQVSVEIYRTWKVGSVAAIGSAHRNVGALLLIVPKELAPDNRGQCWINTGTGSEGIITDATAGAICRDSIIPHLRNKDYAGAIGAGIGALETRLRGDAALAEPAQPLRSSSQSGGMAGIPWIAIAGVLALFAAAVAGKKYLRVRSRTCPRCGKQMRRLDEQADDGKLDQGQRVEEEIRSIDYDAWICGCGECLVIPYRNWFSRYNECRYCHRRAASSTYHVVTPPTTFYAGTAERRFVCEACHQHYVDEIMLPQIPESSSSDSGSSSSSSGSSGGGGSSFGGSGSTSGGGGGSSY